MNNILDGKKVIIFDCDGTMLDSLNMWDEVDRRLSYSIASDKMRSFLDKNEDWKNGVSQFRTESLRRHKDSDMYKEYANDLMIKFWSKMTLDEVNVLRNVIAKEFMINDVELKPDVDKLINYLHEHNYYLVLATVGSKWCLDLYANENKNISSKLDIFNTFDLVLTSNDVTKKKPDPEVYLKSIELSGYKPNECIVFEDSLEGIEASVNAGLEVINIYDKHSDYERDKINKLSKYNFNNYREVIESIKPKTKML